MIDDQEAPQEILKGKELRIELGMKFGDAVEEWRTCRRYKADGLVYRISETVVILQNNARTKGWTMLNVLQCHMARFRSSKQSPKAVCSFQFGWIASGRVFLAVLDRK